MNTWGDRSQTVAEPEKSFALDMIGVGPASTPGRELLAAVVQIGLVLVLLFVVFSDRLPDQVKLLLTGAAVAYFLVRLAVGLPRWRRRRAGRL